MDERKEAPGHPGIPPRWTSSAKVGVGVAFQPASPVWFTLSHGIFNEIYYPRIDSACIRDMGMIVTDGKDFFSEEKRQADSQVDYPQPGVPLYHLVNTDKDGRYQIEKTILADTKRDSVVQWTKFIPLQGQPQDYHVYVLLAPHLGNRGSDNTAWVGDYKGIPMLFAQRDGYYLALACSSGWKKRSVGFVGVSDGWQDLSQHKQLEWEYTQATQGNVALTGEIDLGTDNQPFLLVIGFGTNDAEAGQRARASLLDGIRSLQADYVSGWQEWQTTIMPLQGLDEEEATLYRTSLAVLLTHEAKHFPGGFIASLSIPWGDSKGDNDLGGYHLVWPRDMVETVSGLLAAGAELDARRALDYLQATQEADGHWPQNMWLDGMSYWSGIQVDETAFPFLLMEIALREGVLAKELTSRYWEMLVKAARFIISNGPVTPEDRWEEDPGYSPFTLAVEIASLLIAADFAESAGHVDIAEYFRQTADTWNDGIERWIYVKNTDLAKENDVEGYYIRLAPPDVGEASSPSKGYVPIKNRPPGESLEPAAQIVSPDALALVRFGLRAPDDPRILNTIKVIDSLLKVDFPQGPAWHRYNDDGYGEHADGSPYDGTGIGRAWPLLTGERAHYELAAGRYDQAKRLLKTLQGFSNPGGMIPEQIWDAPDIPDRELYFGQPTGSAMPLVWAHAEYIKLCRSLQDSRVFDMPHQTVQRYLKDHVHSAYFTWRLNQKVRTLPVGKILRIELPEPALIHWSCNAWKTAHDMDTKDTGVGMYICDLPTADFPENTCVIFTIYWKATGKWEETNYEVRVIGE